MQVNTHMKLMRRFKAHLFAACMVFAISQPAYTINDSGLYLITDKTNGDNAIINRLNVQSIYGLNTKRWPNGSDLTVFVLPDNSVLHERFCIEILMMLPYQLRRNWERLIYSGRAGLLITVDSLEEMKKRVSATPGSIGYITQEHLDDSILIVEVR